MGFNYSMAGSVVNCPVEHAVSEGEARGRTVKECSEGRVLGPLDTSEFPYVQTSRYGYP